jgi:glutathione S-transferase
METQTGGAKPTLWQISISHYSEKIRWALEHKRIDHVRRAPLPGMHIPVALWLTGGEHKTLPVLQLDGRTIGDSTAILAALEERFPDPPLYPEDPEQRRRALELEEFFDEQVGPPIRQLLFHDLIGEPELFGQLASEAVSGPMSKAKGLSGAYARGYTSLRWRANDDAEAVAGRAQIVAAMDRLDAELAASGGPYLVGDRFSVADLATASLLFPLVGPEKGPVPAGRPSPAAFEEFRASLSGRPGFQWVEETYRRDR